MNPDDPTTPDTFRCDWCRQWKPRDEMHAVYGNAAQRSRVCDDCLAVPF